MTTAANRNVTAPAEEISRPSSPIHLHYDPLGRLVLSLPSGETVPGVLPVRCFPFSAPNERISFCDEMGRERYCLSTLDELPAPERQLLLADLANREFIPVIKRILSVEPESEPTTWHVETDRGETRFTLPSEDNIRRLGQHGALIADAHGIRFRVLDLRALDSGSRKLLNRYL